MLERLTKQAKERQYGVVHAEMASSHQPDRLGSSQSDFIEQGQAGPSRVLLDDSRKSAV